MKKLFYLFALVSAIVMSSCSSGSKLEFQVAAANKQCPMSQGPGLTISKICTEANNVVYVCDVDEYQANLSVEEMNTPEAMSVMKPAMIQSLTADPETQELIELVKDANYNIVYRLIGSPSNNQVEIVIYPHEL